MTESIAFEEARALAGNLASLWNGGQDALDRITEAAGNASMSPWAALQRLGEKGIEDLFSDEESRRGLDEAFRRLTAHLTSETWFDRAAPEDERLAHLRQRPIAYFCAEFGLASWLPIYAGGLGILAGDFLKEASDMGLPFVGVGLFYRHGFSHQRLAEDGWQIESSDTLDPADLPVSLARDRDGNEILVDVSIADRTVFARIWQLQVGRTTLFLLDTDVPQNADVDRQITDTLYGGGQETRIQQEIVLGIGGVRALRALGIEPSVFSMNEGHAAFLGLELLRENLQRVDRQRVRAAKLRPAVAEATELTRPRIVYTNHTVVPAGNDVFPHDLVRLYLGPWAEQSGIGADHLVQLVGGDAFSMAILAFQLSGKANAVSELHGHVIPREWPGFAAEAVTNGVHVPTWLGAEIRTLLDAYVPDWRSDNPDWERIKNIPDEQLWKAHSAQRHAMVAQANRRQNRAELDPEVLTLVWARRFAEYKRAGMLASDLGRLAHILTDPQRPVQLIVAGKAHPADEGGKRILQGLLAAVRSDSAVAARVAFVEDYDIRIAQYLTRGADVWINIPRRPLEASGTSGMKSSDNGGLQLTVRDGWAAEVEWWNVGWGIQGRSDAQDAADMYGYLEDNIVTCFHTRSDGVPTRWTEMMKNSMIVTLSRYSARRMVHDYLNKLYLPLIAAQPRVSMPSEQGSA